MEWFWLVFICFYLLIDSLDWLIDSFTHSLIPSLLVYYIKREFLRIIKCDVILELNSHYNLLS